MALIRTGGGSSSIQSVPDSITFGSYSTNTYEGQTTASGTTNNYAATSAQTINASFGSLVTNTGVFTYSQAGKYLETIITDSTSTSSLVDRSVSDTVQNAPITGKLRQASIVKIS